MSWHTFPRSTPLRVLRHPVLLVEWLRLANALKRWRSECTSGSLLLTAAAAAGFAGAVTVLSSRFAAAINVLAEYWVLTAVVAAVYAASSVARRRRNIRELHLQSWLVAAPVSPTSIRVSLAIRSVFPILLQLLVATSLILLVTSMASEMRAAGKVIAALAAGFSVGAMLSWRAGVNHSAARSQASRYVSLRRPHGVRQPNGQALSAWPIAQVLAWSRPENSRYVLIVALLAVQGGSSALVGLSVVALYLIGSYLVALLSALLHVARSASAWLRSTPMVLGEFVWLMSRRALVHQAFGTALAAALLLLLGAPIAAILQLAALWLSLVISVSGCALVDCYRGRSPAVKVALCFVAWTAMAAVLQFRSAARA